MIPTAQELDAMSVKEMRLKLAGCFQGSAMWDCIYPTYLMRKDRDEATRSWILFVIKTATSVGGFIKGLFH